MTQKRAVELRLPGITTITGESFASTAEKLMSDYMGQRKGSRDSNKLTTTKLRSIYSLVTNIYVQVNTPEEYEQHRPDIQYLKVRMAYEAGREPSVKAFLEKTHLMKLVDAIESFEQFRLYCRYAESLVAYFKFFGGKDR